MSARVCADTPQCFWIWMAFLSYQLARGHMLLTACMWYDRLQDTNALHLARAVEDHMFRWCSRPQTVHHFIQRCTLQTEACRQDTRDLFKSMVVTGGPTGGCCCSPCDTDSRMAHANGLLLTALQCTKCSPNAALRPCSVLRYASTS